MTELGESVAIGTVTEEEVECPFDHDEPTPPDVINKLIGKGSTLSKQMSDTSPTGTHLYAKIKNDYKPDQVLNPRKDPQHEFYGDKRPVKIDVEENDEIVEYTYPVSCAAHHCIPAQESLKK